ncbi:MAG: hypothetical protein Q4D05_07755, partial [Acinetobacter sp.]|nr:hypothetical protein [Acinetobacter sp.]
MKILILHKWLVAGGVERVLINYLSVFKCLNYEVELLITNDLGEKNVFQKELPENTQYRYVFNQTYFNMWEDLRKNRKKSVFNKAKYEIFKLKDQYYYAKTLNNIIKSKDYDLIIDFSGCLDTLIRNAFFNTRSIPTVRWIHGQLNHQGHKRKIRKYQQIFSKHNKVISLCEE